MNNTKKISTKKISKGLYEFLLEYQAWALAGAPTHPVFNPAYGLCSNAGVYGRINGNSCQDALLAVFAHEFPDTRSAPFGAYAYSEQRLSKTHHLNPQRLDWIAAKIAQYEECLQDERHA